MQNVENGKFVLVHYTGTLESGEVFDSSKGRVPLEVLMGGGQLIAGFEKALVGMELNESKTFTLQPEEAYGPKTEELHKAFERSQIPPNLDPKVGDTVAMQGPGGQPVPAKVIEADDEKVVIDLNHPLAGESLTFEIQVVGINDQATQSQGGCGGCGGGEGGGCGDGGCGEPGSCCSS
ncbi:MAG: peptidylprolyl isomerase [Desulfatibacillum sp.]|nr:peptidylprolyl isomerase [Desulfatibacillum sp.]